MSGFKEIAQRDSCFRAGSTLCPGCMESIAFGNIGRVSDNGIKTVFTIGTSCAEVSSLAFPNIVTPYGVALVILIVANAGDPRRLAAIAVALALVLALDLAAMWFARPLMKVLGSSLQLLGAVLGVLQVALAVELAIQAFVMLGVLQAPPV